MLSNKTPLDILESTIKNMGTSSYNKPASSENQAPNDMNSKKSRLKTEKKVHDLRNNWMLLCGFIDNLNLKDTKEYNEKILKNINHIRGVIDDLVKNLLCTEKEDLEKEETNIRDLIAEIIDNFPKNIKNHIKLDCEGSPITYIDAKKISLAIQNVVLNGIEAINENIKIAININNPKRNKSEKKNYICIKIIDNGHGMTEETMEKIFQPYFTTKKDGEGLGLANVKEIIEKHAGKVDVESISGKGTTFSIYLPSKIAVHQNNYKYRDGNEDLEIINKDEIILIDDNPILIKINERLARELNIKLISADNSKEGLKIIEEAPPRTIVLLDQSLQKNVKGTEVAKKIREKRPDLIIILSTGHRSENFKPLVDNGSIDGILQKPYCLDDLKKLLRI